MSDDVEMKETAPAPVPKPSSPSPMIKEEEDKDEDDGKQEVVGDNATSGGDDDADSHEEEEEDKRVPKITRTLMNLTAAAEVAHYGGSGKYAGSDSDSDSDGDNQPLIKTLGLSLKSVDDVTFAVLSNLYRSKPQRTIVAALCISEDIEQKLALKTTKTDDLIKELEEKQRRIEKVKSRLLLMSEEPFTYRKAILEPSENMKDVEPDAKEDEDDDDDEKYRFPHIRALDVKTLPTNVKWNRVHGPGDFPNYERHVLPKLESVPELKPLCWQYQQCNESLDRLGTAIFKVKQAATVRALASLPGQFDWDPLHEKIIRIGSSYITQANSAKIPELMGKFLESVKLYQSRDAKSVLNIYNTHYEEKLLKRVTALKWLCILEREVRIDMVAGCDSTITILNTLSKVLSSTSLELNPKVTFDGQETLKTLLLRASKRAERDASNAATVALLASELFEEKASDATSILLKVPPAEMKGNSVLHVLVCMMPSLRNATAHPRVEFPDEDTDAVYVDIRLRTLNEYREQKSSSGPSRRRECESLLAVCEKEFAHLGVDWKSTSAERLSTCINQLAQLETAVHRLIRYHGEGLTRADADYEVFRGYAMQLLPLLDRPDVSVLKSGMPWNSATFSLVEDGPAEFRKRLKAAEAENEQKDLTEWKAPRMFGKTAYKRSAECAEGAVKESPEEAEWYRRSMEDFDKSRSKRTAMAAPSRFRLKADGTGYDETIQMVRRYKRHEEFAKRKEAKPPADGKEPKSKKLKREASAAAAAAP